ncbi:MAG TPA: IS66 family insertion sequence element accessory protein TnpB [Polyangiales bacterium]|nr:IS66 family insertion sequence element accessory protein TnpB [Polyangiales bacterium]
MTQKRQRRTVAERAELVERWEQSGLAAREFAAQEKLRASSLYLWRRKLESTSKRELPASARKPAFSEVRLSTAQPQPGHIEIVARNGRVIRIHGDFSVRSLQQVVAAVEQC